MRRVITVNLGGTAFALDEDAYERLRAYVNLTESRLGPNPDRTEIVGDLERAVADRLRVEQSVGAASVVSDTTMEKTLADIGTVHQADIASPGPAVSAGGTKWSSQPAQQDQSDYTRLPVFLLCLFVGWFGVHRFFVGKIGTGILQLLTLGGLTLWTLIDFILILCGEFKDKEGRKITRWT